MAKKHVEALDRPCKFEDVSAKSIREYMKTLLITLWEEGEGFSGKRPFGNSGWEYDVIKPLIEFKYIKGSLDEDGYVEDYNVKEAFTFIYAMIDEIF